MSSSYEIAERRVAAIQAAFEAHAYSDALPLMLDQIADGHDEVPDPGRAGDWFTLGEVQFALKDFNAAFNAFVKATWHAERSGMSDVERSRCLERLSETAEKSGQRDAAIHAFDDVVCLREVADGLHSLQLIEPLLKLADVCETAGQPLPSLVHGLRVWRILARVRTDQGRARDFPVGARALGTIGIARQQLNQNRRADVVLGAALARLGTETGSDPMFVCQALEGQALAVRSLGEEARAISLARQHANIAKDAFGESFEAFRSANRLGTWLYDVGQYKEAVPVLDGALALAADGMVSPVDRAKVTVNLAKALTELDRFRDAEVQIDAAKALLQQADALQSPAAAARLIARVQWLRAQWRNDEARADATEAIDILQAAYGPKSAHLATPLSFLAGIEKDRQDLPAAEAAYARALALDGLRPMQRANTVQNLALIRIKQERFDDARPLAEEALRLKIAELGPQHDRLSVAWANMGVIERETGNFDAALTYQKQAIDAELRMYGPQHSEVAKTRVSLAGTLMAQGDSAAASREMARVLDSQDHRLDELFALNVDEQRISLAREWLPELDTYLTIATGSFRTSDAAVIEAYAYVVRRKGRVSEALASQRQSPSSPQGTVAHRAQMAPGTILSSLLSRLAPGQVLVDYVVFGSATLAAGPHARKAMPGGARYGAFVVSNDHALQFYDLGPADAIDQKVSALWRAIKQRSNSAEIRMLGATVRALIWDPLALGKRHRVIVSTDGGLNNLSFACLPSGSSAWLIDEIDIDYVAAPRDLLTDTSRSSNAGPPIVLSSPAYGDSRNPVWADLPGAWDEGKAVAKALGVTAMADEAATVEALLYAKRPRILHIATHGFYFQASLQRDTSLPPRLAAMAHDPDPLGRAGLAFAGANTWVGGAETDAAPKAVVTARDLLALDLVATELVVLSACETGLGQAEPFDGAHGLRRAFRAAGARGVIVALWNANDAATALLMPAFYASRAAGQSDAAALRNAMIETRKRFPHPSAWASFIHVGCG